jgi:ATP-dependent Lon protease
VDEEKLSFRSTEDVDPAEGIIGQPIAMEAIRFGVESTAPGQNIYVRGTSGTGRMSLVNTLLQELKPQARRRLDRCYVHNFQRPDRPRLITLPSGDGPVLRRRMKAFADYVETRLFESLEGEPLKARREAIGRQTQSELEQITQPLEKDLQQNGLALVQLQAQPASRTAIFPVVEGKPVPPEELLQMVQSGKISEEEFKQIEQKIGRFSSQLQEVSRKANKTWQQGLKTVQQFMASEARALLQSYSDELLANFSQEKVTEFISEVIDDVIENRIRAESLEGQPPPQVIYGINVVCTHDGETSPVITENSPTVLNLLGTVEPEFVGGGQTVTNYRGIRAGTLVHADGGYLILDARDILSEPGAWRMLMRALRTGCVEIVPPEMGWPMATHSLKPEPIEISVRIILIGGSNLYHQLDQVDQDFSDMFKVLADFSTEIERSDLGINQYAGVVSRMCRNEGLPHFSAGGIAALAEHGARVASRKGKITARFGRIADIVREAAFLSNKEQVQLVTRAHIEDAVRRTKYRASLPSSRFQELINDGTIMLETSGSVVGQINGLAIISAGPILYGFPARITATIGAGQAGIINIEGAAAMSGAIHTKGFHNCFRAELWRHRWGFSVRCGNLLPVECIDRRAITSGAGNDGRDRSARAHRGHWRR